MYVCMSVRNGFTMEIYVFRHSSHTFWHVPLTMSSCDGVEIRLRIRKMEDDARTSPDVWKTVNCSTKDERQDNDDKK